MLVHWQTPTHTTDKLLISGTVTAQVCRDAASSSPHKRAAAGCTVVEQMKATPGEESETADVLPAALVSGQPHVLAYRVQLLNAAGRSAGPSAPVFAVSGEAPPVVAALTAKSTKAGVLLQWKAQPADGTVVVLDRTVVQAPVPKPAAAKGPESLLASPAEATETKLKAGDSDAGGTLDRTAQIGRTYRYTAQRVRTVVVGGQTLEARSEVSAPIAVKVEDVFAPEIPMGLVAVPGFAGEGASARPTVDLSWEPNLEPRLAGYRVYRRDLDGAAPMAWKLITAQPLQSAAFSDHDVVAGRHYAYRITGVSDAGVESVPSAEAQETAQAPE